MRARLDPESPLPLYWQVVEAVRYRVATGELTPGERLPSLREAAEAWGINMHTVRRAYGELAERGLVEIRPRSGTVVSRRPGPAPTSGHGSAGPAGEASGTNAAGIRSAGGDADFDMWIRGVAREAGARWGLAPRQLGAALSELPSVAATTDQVLVVECSESQSTDLARQLSDRWRVTARPWSLEREGEPPRDAILVATYFHYNDVRVRWPDRFPQVRFVATRPDAAVRESLDRLRDLTEGPVTVLVWEREEAMARNIAADLLRILPQEEFSLRRRVGPLEAVPRTASDPILFSPRTWAELPEEDRCRKEFVEVRYVFEPEDLERLARDLDWERR